MLFFEVSLLLFVKSYLVVDGWSRWRGCRCTASDTGTLNAHVLIQVPDSLIAEPRRDTWESFAGISGYLQHKGSKGVRYGYMLYNNMASGGLAI